MADWAAALDRKTLERAVRPASLHVALRSLWRNKLVRNYRIDGNVVYLDADMVALELALDREPY